MPMSSASSRSASSALLLTLLASAASAKPLALPETVISGSRSPSSSFSQPSSVNLVDMGEVGAGQPRINASEVLSRVPGLVVQNRHNYAQDLQISSRGFGSRSAFGVRGIKLITDGIPASTPDGQGQAATFNLDTAERIEVLRGPSATLYGSNAGGVIQVFSRDGRGRPRVGVETLAGSDGLNRHHLSAEGGNEHGGFVLDASRMDTDGFRDHSAARRDQTFAKVHVEPDAHSRLSLVFSSLEQNGTQDPLGQDWAGYQADRRSVTPNAVLYDTRKSIDHQQLGANYERAFGDASLQATVYAGRRSVLQYLAIPAFVQRRDNATHNGGVVDFDREFHGGSLRWLQPVGESVDLVFGLDYDFSEDDRQGYQNFSGDLLGVKGALRRDELNSVRSLDPYVQGTWRSGNWTVQGGLRYSTLEMEVDDRYIVGPNGDDSGSQRFEQASPTVAVGYAFSPDLNAYISVGRGFETPTLAETAYAPGGESGGNLGLEPSTSTQYEVGIKARLWQHSRLDAALFQIDTEDELVVADSSGGRTSYRNAGRTQRRGLELSLHSQLSEEWSSQLSYTYLQARYANQVQSGGDLIEEGNDLPGVPRTSLFAELTWSPGDGISTALEGLYRSEVQVEDNNRERAAPGYVVFNWRARFEQRLDALTFHQTLRLENILDREYIGSVIVGDGNGRYYEAAPGRSWFAGAGVEYRF